MVLIWSMVPYCMPAHINLSLGHFSTALSIKDKVNYIKIINDGFWELFDSNEMSI